MLSMGFPGGSLVKNPPANVGDMGWEDPLEKEMATHSSILAWRIPWTEEPGGLQSMGSHRVGQTGTEHSHIIRTTHTPCTLASFRSVVTNLFGPRDWFHGRQFFYGGVGMGQGMVQAVMRVMGSGRWSLAPSPSAHFLLCSAIPNSP